MIIGGNRFVGRLIAKQLYDQNYYITVLNRTGTKPFDECDVIKMDRGDISNTNISPEIVIDMCAYNVNQVKNLFKSLNITNLSQYIVISSIASEYSFFGEYGKNKAEIELFLRFEANIPYVILRPTYIIGKTDPHKRIDYFLNCIENGYDLKIDGYGNEKLSFVFMEDVALVINKVVQLKVINKTYNICNDEKISMNKLIKLFFKITGKNTSIQYQIPNSNDFKDKQCVFSNKLTKDDLNIKFKTLEKGICEYIISKS